MIRKKLLEDGSAMSVGGGYKGKVRNGKVLIEKVEDRKDKSLVFLRKGNALFVVEGLYFNGDLNEDEVRYFYEEHSCPTNYIGVELIADLDDGDTDPHGIFEFLGVIPFEDLSGIYDIRPMLDRLGIV